MPRLLTMYMYIYYIHSNNVVTTKNITPSATATSRNTKRPLLLVCITGLSGFVPVYQRQYCMCHGQCWWKRMCMFDVWVVNDWANLLGCVSLMGDISIMFAEQKKEEKQTQNKKSYCYLQLWRKVPTDKIFNQIDYLNGCYQWNWFFE